MTGFVVPFLRRKIGAVGWTQAELAEFYRVEATLIAAGMRIGTDRGLTDENDPWFVFFHADDEQKVIIHFARIDGSYLVSAPGLGSTETGGDFRTLVRQLLSQYDEITARRQERALHGNGPDKSGKVVLHPAAMLWVLVALAFVKSAEARPADGHHAVADYDPELAPPRDSGSDPLSALINFALQSIIVTWAVGAMASDVHMGSDDKFPHWLGAEPSVVLETAGTFTTAEFSAAGSSGNDHGAPEIGWANHQGSGGTPVPGNVAITTSEHPVLDHVDDHPGSVLVASAHVAIEAVPVVADPVLPVAHPIPEALAVFAAAEANVTQKSVENLPALPDVIATVLGHAIHSSENGQGQVSDALSQLAGHTSVTTSQADETALAPVGGNTAPVSPPVSSVAAVAAVPAAALPDHSADTLSVAHAASTTPTPVSVTALTAPPGSLDSSEVIVATSAVHEFLASVPQAVTIVSPNNLIVYDPLAVNIDLAHVQALTFDFADGSHISLIGLPSELTHALTGHS